MVDASAANEVLPADDDRIGNDDTTYVCEVDTGSTVGWRRNYGPKLLKGDKVLLAKGTRQSCAFFNV